MITVRPSRERGHANHGWLDTYHTFSFADYHDPKQMGFSHLRVINEDRVQPAEGFSTHSHRDMEIITYVLFGALAHRDSMGNSSVICPGEIQIMSAGTGVTHSEYNDSRIEIVHPLQIWILPAATGLPPGYQQKAIDAQAQHGKLALLASQDGRDGSLVVHQDTKVFSSILDRSESVQTRLAPNRRGWLQVARGAVSLNGKPLGAGDGGGISEESSLTIEASQPAEVLLFDLA